MRWAPLCAVLVAASVAACAARPHAPQAAPPQVVSLPDATMLAEVADDAATLLPRWYPQGATRWVLKRPANDAFSVALVDRLRREGYAVQETGPRRATDEPAMGGVALDFVFERMDDRLHRLTLRAGSRTLSRAYLRHEGRVYAAGAWAQRE